MNTYSTAHQNYHCNQVSKLPIGGVNKDAAGQKLYISWNANCQCADVETLMRLETHTAATGVDMAFPALNQIFPALNPSR